MKERLGYKDRSIPQGSIERGGCKDTLANSSVFIVHHESRYCLACGTKVPPNPSESHILYSFCRATPLYM